MWGYNMAASTQDRITREQACHMITFLGPMMLRNSFSYDAAGSFRRGNKILGDIDFVLVNGKLRELSEDLHEQANTRTLRCGESILSVLLPYGDKEIQAEFNITTEKTLGAALLHSTGGAEFNMELRTYAKQQGWKLNQYGLHMAGRRTICKTETDIFKALGLHFIPPDERSEGLWNVIDLYLR